MKILSLCTILSFASVGVSFGGLFEAAQADSVNALVKELPKDAIVSVTDVITGHDTLRIGKMIAIKVKTTRPITTFTTLYIDGTEIPNIRPARFSMTEPVVYFEFGDIVREVTSDLFGKLPSDKTYVSLSVSVGNKQEGPLAVPIYAFLELRQKVSSAWVYVLAGMLALIIFMGLKNNILMDDTNLYYSLGRTQLFFWTLLFSVCYLLIWLRTGTLPDVTTSALVILGISVGTTAAGKVVENNNKDIVPIDPNAKSEGWFRDILSDGSSMNIHRFQNVIFNVIFGVLFLQRCITTNAMPVFDDNVMILLGISSGTYAGLKVTEPVKEQNKPSPVTGEDEKPQG